MLLRSQGIAPPRTTGTHFPGPAGGRVMRLVGNNNPGYWLAMLSQPLTTDTISISTTPVNNNIPLPDGFDYPTRSLYFIGKMIQCPQKKLGGCWSSNTFVEKRVHTSAPESSFSSVEIFRKKKKKKSHAPEGNRTPANCSHTILNGRQLSYHWTTGALKVLFLL